MVKFNRKNITIALVMLLGLAIVGFWGWKNFAPGNLDAFAQCLSDKGLKFYGAFWCSHCQNQKKLFRTSQRFLPYIECSELDGKGQLQICSQAGIQSYPTWEFPDGTRAIGELSLQNLFEKSDCQLP